MFREATSKLKPYYTTIYSVAYSSCGYYLAAANNFGEIAIFNLTPLLDFDVDCQLNVSQKYPVFKFYAHKGPIYSLLSSGQFLISGGIGEIKVWKWADLRKNVAKTEWIFTVPQGGNLSRPEVNSMVSSKKAENEVLYAGCGDNKIYCLDFERKTLLFTLEGHTDYVHCVDLLRNAQECVSGGEDGSVRIWDARKGGSAVHILEPYKHKTTSRSHLGKWINCLALDSNDDWLACGGAPALCIWHLRSLSPSTTFVKQDSITNAVCFHNDMVIAGGSEPYINQWSFDGSLEVEVPTSASEVFCLNINSTSSKQVLIAGGCSYKIDLCTNFRYKDFSLFFQDNRNHVTPQIQAS